MVWNTSEIRTEQDRAAALEGLRGLHRRHLQGEPARHRRLRRAPQPLHAALRGRRPDGRASTPQRSTPPSATRPATACSTCPGTNPCPALGLAGGSDGPTARCSPPSRSSSRRASAWPGTSSAPARPRSAAASASSTPRERLSPGLALGQNPPFSGTTAVTRTLDSTSAVVGDAGSPSARPQRHRAGGGQPPQLAVEPVRPARARAQHGARGGLRRQQGPRPARPDQPQRGRARRTASPTRTPATSRCGR